MNRMQISGTLFILPALLLVLFFAQWFTYESSEPFFNNDETRHVMTGVFFRDLLVDRPVTKLVDYTIRYYLQ